MTDRSNASVRRLARLLCIIDLGLHIVSAIFAILADIICQNAIFAEYCYCSKQKNPISVEH